VNPPGVTEAKPCEHCGQVARYGIEDRCRACNYPIAQWAPNVQLAQQPGQVEALDARFRTACQSGEERGVAEGLERLKQIAKGTAAVVNVPVGLAYDLYTRNSALYGPYAVLTEAGVRSPSPVDDDRRRRAVDSLLYGGYSEKIVYAALSADGSGLHSYGAVHLELEEKAVAYRSTVLEENSYHFMERHDISPGKPLPKGYMASWEDRSKLAVAKLEKQVEAEMEDSELSRLLLRSVGDRQSDRFLEVHIYGTFNYQAVRRLRTPRSCVNDVEAVMVRALVERAGAAGGGP